MNRVSRTVLVALLAGALSATGCVSDSILGSHTKDQMLKTALPGHEMQVITLRVRDKKYGRLTVDQTVVEVLRKREGILQVRRGTGREEIYVLTETFVDPYSLASSAPERYSVRVIDVERTEPPEVPK